MTQPARDMKVLAWRLVLLVAGAGVAWVAARDAALAVMRGIAETTGQAQSFDPWVTVLASPRVGQDGAPVKIGEAARSAARQALIDRPLGPQAIWFLQPQIAGQGERDLAVLKLGERVSRRDLATQMSLGRLEAERQNLTSSVVHIDRILRVAARGAQPLHQSLALGLDNPELRKLLVPYKNRSWMEAVLAQAVGAGPRPESVAAFLKQARFPPDILHKARLDRLLRRLVAAGNFGDAYDIARLAGYGGSTDPKDFGISDASMDQRFAPLAWALGNSDAVGASFPDNSGILAEVQPGKGDIVASRSTAYPAGTYRLEMDVLAEEAPAGVDVSWSMTCISAQGSQRPVKQDRLIKGPVQNIVVDFTVPTDCAVQNWSIRASNLNNQLAANLELRAIGLVKKS